MDRWRQLNRIPEIGEVYTVKMHIDTKTGVKFRRLNETKVVCLVSAGTWTKNDTILKTQKEFNWHMRNKPNDFYYLVDIQKRAEYFRRKHED